MLSRRAESVSAALPLYTQEDILALLAWREEAQEVIDLLQPDNFTGAGEVDYRHLARVALDFWHEFKGAPKDHFTDAALQGASEAARERLLPVLFALRDLAPRLNLGYLRSRLHQFIAHSQLREKISSATASLAAGRIEDAEKALARPLWRPVEEAGLSFADTGRLEKYLQDTTNRYPCGVGPFDQHRIGPGRKELFLVIAPPKRGKSWWLIHLAKQALLARARVLHISLEMRREQVLLRYLQAFLGRGRYAAGSSRAPRLLKDTFGTVIGLEQEVLGELKGLSNGKGLLPDVVRGAQTLAQRYDLRVLEYPPRSLTAVTLESALDRLARESRFVPDLVVVDYGDLMKVDASNYRLSVGDAFLQLRRIAVDRDLAVVTASQSNRESTRATLVTESDVAEDFSKIATADWSLTYSQTAAERVLGLARIFVAAGRDAQDKQTAVIAQSYARGQFCLDAARLPDKWTTMLADAAGGVDGAE